MYFSENGKSSECARVARSLTGGDYTCSHSLTCACIGFVCVLGRCESGVVTVVTDYKKYGKCSQMLMISRLMARLITLMLMVLHDGTNGANNANANANANSANGANTILMLIVQVLMIMVLMIMMLMLIPCILCLGQTVKVLTVRYLVGRARACHARDNQSHPRPKDLPSHLVPLPSRLLQIAEITRASPLCNPYVTLHHLASPQPNLEHHKTSPERIQPHATNLAISPARPGSHRSTRLLENSLKSLLLSLRYI